MQNHHASNTEQNTDLDWVAWLLKQRRRIIDNLLKVVLVVGLFGLGYVWMLAIRAHRLSFNTGFYSVSYLLILWLYFARKLSDKIRALALFALLYGFAVVSLYVGWLAGSGRLFLLVLVPVSGILISPKVGVRAAVLVLITYAFYGLAFNRGWFALGPLPDPTDPSPVFVEGVGFAISVALLVASQWFLAQALNAANQARVEAEKAREEAVQSEHLKTQFLANVSHELRTPLNAVINFTQFVSSGLYGPVNEQQTDALKKATDSGRHLLELINDILDMSKIEAGRMNLRIESDIDLYVELEAVVAATQTLLADRPVKLVKEIEDGLPLVLGDRRRIRQILLNLVANAAKFTSQGQICLRVRRVDDQVVFEVEDTGPGVVPAEQAKIFRPFYRSDDSAGASGTGLGLSIARHLAEAHGGKIWLKSTPGSGSTFYYSHPIKSANLVDLLETNHEETA